MFASRRFFLALIKKGTKSIRFALLSRQGKGKLLAGETYKKMDTREKDIRTDVLFLLGIY